MSILGSQMTNENFFHIGYLRENAVSIRTWLERCLSYFASLKGLSEDQIKDVCRVIWRSSTWLTMPKRKPRNSARVCSKKVS